MALQDMTAIHDSALQMLLSLNVGKVEHILQTGDMTRLFIRIPKSLKLCGYL